MDIIELLAKYLLFLAVFGTMWSISNLADSISRYFKKKTVQLEKE